MIVRRLVVVVFATVTAVAVTHLGAVAAPPGVPVSFHYASESDGHLYPLPGNAPIEGGPRFTGDRHVIVVNRDTCTDYELFAAYPAGVPILADNGSPWFISGAPSPHRNDGALHQLDRLTGRDFEVVDTSSLPHPGR